MFLIGCPIKDNQESHSHWSANPSSGPYLTGTGKTLHRRFDHGIKKSCQETKVICGNKNVIALLFIIPAENNLE